MVLTGRRRYLVPAGALLLALAVFSVSVATVMDGQCTKAKSRRTIAWGNTEAELRPAVVSKNVVVPNGAENEEWRRPVLDVPNDVLVYRVRHRRGVKDSLWSDQP